MEKLPLISKAGRIHVAYMAVHIPFYIRNIRLMQDSPDRIHDVIADSRTAKIQNELIASERRLPAGNPYCIFGMCPVQIAVGINHLGFKPQAELHTEPVDFSRKFRQASPKLPAVYVIITKPCRIIISFAEPAVIENKQFDSQTAGSFGEVNQLAPGEREEVSFPVIQQDRPFFSFPVAPYNMFIRKVMKMSAHSVITLITESHNGFG